jgi:hypothetical protein
MVSGCPCTLQQPVGVPVLAQGHSSVRRQQPARLAGQQHPFARTELTVCWPAAFETGHMRTAHPGPVALTDTTRAPTQTHTLTCNAVRIA